MLRILAITTALLAAALPLDASACSFAPGYRTFELSSTQLPGSGASPTTPSVSVLSIFRGTDDGDYASCSDAGILFISIDDPEAAQDLGFLFELEHGSFPDAVLPEEIVAPIELADGSFGFFFVWLDLPAGSRDVEPIDVRVSVRAVSPTMLEGQKVFLDIRDP
ncbi:MAG: hypothetical protein QNI99_09880 [Woeseiaceae bacterium]|nr:hypothetical protein [Woeseiaceae bacterium]